jgi:hypothetical protein
MVFDCIFFSNYSHNLGIQPNALFQGGEKAMQNTLAATTDWVRVRVLIILYYSLFGLNMASYC